MQKPTGNSDIFKYCPKCVAAALRFVKFNKLVCGVCSFEYYHNTAAAVVAIITNDKGQLLFVERAREPSKGMLDMPGGFADPDESAEQALIREVKEELNLEVMSLEYFCSEPNTSYEYKGVIYKTIDFAYICKIDDISKAKPADDVNAIIFISPDKVEPDKIAFDSTKNILAHYIAGL